MTAANSIYPVRHGGPGSVPDQASAIACARKVRAHILPDAVSCVICVGDLSDPANRRFLYPFNSCADCGPRYRILETLPYDRANTSMDRFPFCDACQREYESIGDRRFHAQSCACSNCGPVLSLVDTESAILGIGASALDAARSTAADARSTGSVVSNCHESVDTV